MKLSKKQLNEIPIFSFKELSDLFREMDERVKRGQALVHSVTELSQMIGYESRTKMEAIEKLDRPLVRHKHTESPWVHQKNKKPYLDEIRNSEGARLFIVSDRDSLNNGKLASKSPELLQIAEMYFDSMRSKGEQNSFPFLLTRGVLKSISDE